MTEILKKSLRVTRSLFTIRHILNQLDQLTVANQGLQKELTKTVLNHENVKSPLIVQTALDNYSRAKQSAREGLDPGIRWGVYADWCDQQIQSLTEPRQVIHFAQDPHHHGGFDCRPKGADLVQMAAYQERHLVTSYPEQERQLTSFTESPYSEADSVLMLNGRLVSIPMYAHASFILSITRTIGPVNRVCEIGGGFGAPARLWLTNTVNQAKKYVIVDLPQSLFFSEVYLRSHFPELRYYYVSGESGPGKDLLKDHDIVLCPAHRIGDLNETAFDLVLNTHSMQEMSSEYVDYYMDWLDKAKAPYFYSTNYFLQDLGALAESPNLLAPRPSPLWACQSVFHGGVAPWTCAEFIFRRLHDEFEVDSVRQGCLNKLKGISGELSDQNACQVIDAMRFCTKPSELLKAIQSLLKQYPKFPKEILYYALRAEKEAAKAGDIETAREAGEIVKPLQARRQPDKEGLVSANLAHMHVERRRNNPAAA